MKPLCAAAGLIIFGTASSSSDWQLTAGSYVAPVCPRHAAADRDDGLHDWPRRVGLVGAVGRVVRFRRRRAASRRGDQVGRVLRTRPANGSNQFHPWLAAALPPGVVNFADVAERINPAVVNIEAIDPRLRNERRRRREQLDANPQGPSSIRPQSGSGFVIDASGEILTNYHVIQNAERIMVKFSDGRSLQARVLGIDPDTDIALIKVDAQESAGRAAWRLADAAGRRVGVRDRQSARLRAHGHGRRRQLSRPQAVRQRASTITSRPTRRSISATAEAR